jgi:hypothetical protein
MKPALAPVKNVVPSISVMPGYMRADGRDCHT